MPSLLWSKVIIGAGTAVTVYMIFRGSWETVRGKLSVVGFVATVASVLAVLEWVFGHLGD